MQKLPDSIITIDQISKAVEAFRSTVVTPQEKKRTTAGTNIDSILKMTSLFAKQADEQDETINVPEQSEHRYMMKMLISKNIFESQDQKLGVLATGVALAVAQAEEWVKKNFPEYEISSINCSRQ